MKILLFTVCHKTLNFSQGLKLRPNNGIVLFIKNFKSKPSS